MDETKPGVKTSEFWVTAITQIIGVLAVFGVVTPEQSQTLLDVAPVGVEVATESVEAISAIITKIMGLIVMLGSSFGYAHSRAKTKGGAK